MFAVLLSRFIVAAAITVGFVVRTTFVVAIVVFVVVVCVILIDGIIGVEQWRCSCVRAVTDITTVVPTASVVSFLSRVAFVVGGVSRTFYLAVDFIDMTSESIESAIRLVRMAVACVLLDVGVYTL